MDLVSSSLIEGIYVSPTGVLAGILSFLPEKQKIQQNKIHEIFYEMREKGVEILNVFSFDTRDIYPWSNTLEEAFCNLRMGSSLGVIGQEQPGYTIETDLKKYAEQQVGPKLSLTERDAMRRVAEEIKKYL
jgi:hypothetical protein